MPDVKTSLVPVYQSDRVRLYGGDAREVLHHLVTTGETFGAVITDAPYTEWWYVADAVGQETIDIDQDMEWHGIVFSRLLLWFPHVRLTRPGIGWFFAEPHYVGSYLRAARYLRWPHVGFWMSLNAPDHVEYLLAFSDAWRPSLDDQRVVHEALTLNTYGQGKNQHMLRLLLRASPPGAVIDPFAGSASTLLAAVEEGRSAVGIELDAQFLRQAAARLRVLESDLALTRREFTGMAGTALN